MTICFKLNIFHNNLKENAYRQVYTTRTHCINFCREKFQEIVVGAVTYLLKNRVIFHRTLINAITDVFMRIFWNTCTENFGKYSEKGIYWSCNTRLKALLQVLFCKCSEKKDNLKISKIPKSLFKWVSFYLTLYVSKSKFPTSTKTDPNKSASFEFCQETVYNEGTLLK